MVFNVLVRFIWIWFIPRSTVAIAPRAFFFALLEMLRRWQWNFFRVETEQVGNTDQYRVTREVPLPYRISPDEDDMDDDIVRIASRKSERKGLRGAAVKLGNLRTRLLARKPLAAEAEEQTARRNHINAGPYGDPSHREYEERATTMRRDLETMADSDD